MNVKFFSIYRSYHERSVITPFLNINSARLLLERAVKRGETKEGKVYKVGQRRGKPNLKLVLTVRAKT